MSCYNKTGHYLVELYKEISNILNMKYLSFLLIILFAFIVCGKQEKVRQPAVAGAFYSNNSKELKKNVDAYLKKAKTKKVSGKIRALISPHAGYIYSGPIAATGYKLLKGRKIKTVIVLAPSHRFPLRKPSIMDVEAYQTPLGSIQLSPKVRTLRKNPLFISEPRAHVQEHSLEVQLPFLQCVLKNFKIIPIVVGQGREKQIAKALKPLIDRNTLVVASSDLSHFHNYQTAMRKDKACVDAICRQDFAKTGVQEACGKSPVLILMHLAEMMNWTPKLLDLRNSGDTAGDKSRVVGYASIVYTQKKGVRNMKEKQTGPVYNSEERKYLLKLARETIVQYLEDGRRPLVNPDDLKENMKEEKGCFVTLHKHGQLRGCIGNILPHGPLYESVIDNAVSAAVRDPRFHPVTSDEVDGLHMEISVLSVPALVAFSSPDDLLAKLTPMKDGVILKLNGRQSTFLPQVWEQLPDKEMFLSHLSQKAGFPADAWKSPEMEVYTYQAEVFEE